MATSIAPESIDLAELSFELGQHFDERAPVGYLEGRTILRDLVVDDLGCSELEAEELVDTMIARGFFRFSGDPGSAADVGTWELSPIASSTLSQ